MHQAWQQDWGMGDGELGLEFVGHYVFDSVFLMWEHFFGALRYHGFG